LRFQLLQYENLHKTYVKHLNCKLYYRQLHLKYWCNLARYWLQAVWGWQNIVETCSSVIICEIIVHLLGHSNKIIKIGICNLLLITADVLHAVWSHSMFWRGKHKFSTKHSGLKTMNDGSRSSHASQNLYTHSPSTLHLNQPMLGAEQT
jgi:hypothetical protein